MTLKPSIISAAFKTKPTDFKVNEHLGFTLSGEGEHLCLYIEKINTNTMFVAQQLAKWADIPLKDVSYSGLKDRFAVTQQWFSLRIPKKCQPDTTFNHPDISILKQTWHNKKLQRGCHQYNSFQINLLNVVGDSDAINAQLNAIKLAGVPNYFGAQRFGRNGANIDKAKAMFAGKRVKRNERSILLSAVRSYLFNQILNERIALENWQTPLLGDVFNLAGSQSIFIPEDIDDELINRLQTGDIHITGALWGTGELKSKHAVADLEKTVADKHPELVAGLIKAGLKQQRRALRMLPKNLVWQFSQADCSMQQQTNLSLSFDLPSGCYATALMMAIIQDFNG